MELHEHSRFVLTADVTGDDDEELKLGDVGVIVHIHPGGEAFVGEFVTLNGKSSVIATVLSSQARPVTDKDIVHARPLEIAA